MAGQVAYHLLAQAGAARTPWPITTIVSCLPVLVLAMGTTLAHMLRADAAPDALDRQSTGRATAWSPDQPAGDSRGPDRVRDDGPDDGSGASAIMRKALPGQPGRNARTTAPERCNAGSQIGQARLIARRLTAAGKPVTRRALRSAGIRGSNESINAVARKINAELADRRRDPS
jgi:hypothetical protein